MGCFSPQVGSHRLSIYEEWDPFRFRHMIPTEALQVRALPTAGEPSACQVSISSLFTVMSCVYCLCVLTCAALCVCLCMLTCAVSIAAIDSLPLPCETQKSSGLAAGTLTCSAISLALGSHYSLYACELFVYSFWVYQPISYLLCFTNSSLPSLLPDLLIEI